MSDLYAVRSGKLKLKGEKVESKDEKKKKEKKRKREKKEQEESKRQKTLEASDTQRFVFEETRQGWYSQNYEIFTTKFWKRCLALDRQCLE
jgi:hypothetical protein